MKSNIPKPGADRKPMGETAKKDGTAPVVPDIAPKAKPEQGAAKPKVASPVFTETKASTT